MAKTLVRCVLGTTYRIALVEAPLAEYFLYNISHRQLMQVVSLALL